MTASDGVVIGAGIVGSAIACFVAREGVSVDGPASATSGVGPQIVRGLDDPS